MKYLYNILIYVLLFLALGLGYLIEWAEKKEERVIL